PSGIVLAIIREDLADLAPKTVPTMMQYRTYVKEKSLYNTPPTFAIYMGGLAAMAERNQEKAAILYDFLDQSELFKGSVDRDSRSLMNVCFRCGSEEM